MRSWKSWILVAVVFTLVGWCRSDVRAGEEGGDPPGAEGDPPGVKVYQRSSFDKEAHGWKSAYTGVLEHSDESVSGKSLRVSYGQKGIGAETPVSVSGSRDLRIAVHMRGRSLPFVMIKMYDEVAKDNTTAYGYRYLRAKGWTPILYHIDRFRYNSRQKGFLNAKADFSLVRFFASAKSGKDVRFTIDNLVVYRGPDRQPPAKVAGLEAKATEAGVRLSWQPAEDNVAAQTYVISRSKGERGFSKIAESCVPSYTDTSAGTGPHSYRVMAVDFEENLGPWSDMASVTPTSESEAPVISPEEKDRLGYAANVKKVHARGAGKVRRGHATMFGDSLTHATTYEYAAKSAFLTMTVKAFGYPRMKTSFGKDRIAEILKKDNPEFMCILFGTNNSKAEKNLGPAMEDLSAIVKACEENGTVPLLGTIPPRGFKDPKSQPEARYNARVIELAGKLKVPVGYVFEEIQAAGDRRKYISRDGVHWTQPGKALAGRAWAKALDQVRFVLRDRL